MAYALHVSPVHPLQMDRRQPWQ